MNGYLGKEKQNKAIGKETNSYWAVSPPYRGLRLAFSSKMPVCLRIKNS